MNLPTRFVWSGAGVDFLGAGLPAAFEIVMGLLFLHVARPSREEHLRAVETRALPPRGGPPD